MIEITPITVTKITEVEEDCTADYFRVTGMNGIKNHADLAQSIFYVDWEVGMVENDEFVACETGSTVIEGYDALNLLATQTTGNSTIWDETEASIINYLMEHNLL